MSENNAGSKVSFFLVGLGIGALVGILFAPKSGEETREYLSAKADEGREYAQRKARALQRDEEPQDLVGAVFFLASPDADFLSGQTLNVDGGKHML